MHTDSSRLPCDQERMEQERWISAPHSDSLPQKGPELGLQEAGVWALSGLGGRILEGSDLLPQLGSWAQPSWPRLYFLYASHYRRLSGVLGFGVPFTAQRRTLNFQEREKVKSAFPISVGKMELEIDDT